MAMSQVKILNAPSAALLGGERTTVLPDRVAAVADFISRDSKMTNDEARMTKFRHWIIWALIGHWISSLVIFH
jgi:hypothetical protein